MKNVAKHIILAGSLLVCAQISFAYSVCSRTGSITECGAGKLDELDVAGKATLNETTVTGDTHIAGMLNAKNANLNTLNIAGKATFFTSHVRGAAKISGLLASCNTSFNKKITISSDKAYFDHSEANEIEVNPGGDTQVVYLGNNTLVKGNISFSSGHGLVVIDSTSRVIGRVIGGDISQKEFDSYCEGENNNDD
jgi:hypothetical protein